MSRVSAEDTESLRALGAFLTGSEAGGIAARLAAGATLSQALGVVPAPRRRRARKLMNAGGLGPQTREHSVAVLSAVAGAAAKLRDVTPVWTAPAGTVGGGPLTGDVFALVGGANSSLVCATFNLQPTSVLWSALLTLCREKPGVSVRLYLDTQAADGPFSVGAEKGNVRRRSKRHSGRSISLDTNEVARQLRGAVVMRTRAPEDGRRAVTSPPSSSASTTASCWWAARASPAAPRSATSNSACASTTPPWRTAWRSSCGILRESSTSRCMGDGLWQ